jgi:hypothetical protein
MNNVQAIELWKKWVEENEAYPGDVTVADEPKVDFWFAKNGKEANRFFLCFANGGDGSLLAVYSKTGKFESGPVVHLGHEGDTFVIAGDVPGALALAAASGDSYEQAIYYDDDLALDEPFADWLRETFDVNPPKSVSAAVKAAGAKHGEAAVNKHIQELNAG